MALLLTVTTNLLGVVTVPFFVKAVVRAGGDAKIDAVDLLIKLVRKGAKEGGRGAKVSPLVMATGHLSYGVDSTRFYRATVTRST